MHMRESLVGVRLCRAQATVTRTALVAVLLAVGVTQSKAVAQGSRQGEFDVFEATIPELQDAMASGTVTSAELVDAYLARIAAYDKAGPRLNAILRLNPNARLEAEALDRERADRGARGPLHGIPIILKDNYDTRDLPTSAGSVALAGLVPPDDAFQVRKLREAGAIILGKANMHELAMGITTISSLGGQTLNPYDPSRNPGGSSGGTGAAVAASFAAIGWGSDTCGSIRIPASQNGLFGLRPTKGLSSIDGIVPLCHTQDVGGPLARTAVDLAIGLDATIGADPADPATRALDGVTLPHFVAALDSAALSGARIGALTLLFGDAPEDTEADSVVRAALEQMRQLGAEIVEVDVPGLDSLLHGSSVITYEFKFDFIDYLAATPGAPVGSLQDILDRGLYHAALESRYRARNRVERRDSDAYRAALAKRSSVREAVIAALERERLDALAYPSIRRKAARIGDPQRGSNCQLSASSDLPALSVPAGFTADGMPVGLELLGLPFADARLVALGYSFEQSYHPRRPPPETPPLVAGRAPDPVAYGVVASGVDARAVGRFEFDVTTGRLSYEVSVSGVPAGRVYSISLQRAVEGDTGPVVHRLSGPGVAAASGTLELSVTDRAALAESRLYMSVYAAGYPGAAARGVLVPRN